MAVTQNTYTGDGATVLFPFTFPYLETTDIKVSLNGNIATTYTLANATTIEFNTAPANGDAIRIYRATDDSQLNATFYPGSAIRSSDLNDNFTQNLYSTQEAINYSIEAIITADGAVTTADAATATANGAVSTANAATATANTAASDAAAAVSTANTASTNASAAVTTANSAATDAATALSTANTAFTTANTALTTANTADTNASAALTTANTADTNATAAVSTANTASTNASTAVSTANTAASDASTALTTANTAISTANAAASAVALAILYDTVANVAAIPGSPANNDAVEVVDSTGIESFTPLSGVPVGFVGDSGLSVRLVYTTSGATWNWIQYFPIDPETRYGDSITTLQGDVTTLQGDVTTLQGDVTTLQGDVTTIQSDVTTIQGDVLGLDNNKLDLAGGTMTGALTLAADPTTNLGAATKQYVDNNIPSSIESGTVMLFVQTNAPTGWTKSTTHNDKTLRVVSGSASSGGTTAFSTVFTSRTPTGTVGSTTLTTAQIPSHSHDYTWYPSKGVANGTPQYALYLANPTLNLTTQNTGGGNSHDHSFTATAMDFAVQYVDVIIATKD